MPIPTSVQLRRQNRLMRRRLQNSLLQHFEKLTAAAEAFVSDREEELKLKRLSTLAKAIKDMQGLLQLMPEDIKNTSKKEFKDIEYHRTELARRLAKFVPNQRPAKGSQSPQGQ